MASKLFRVRCSCGNVVNAAPGSACGMSRNGNDIKFVLTPTERFGFFKVWMKPGVWTNDFVLEMATPDEMPE